MSIGFSSQTNFGASRHWGRETQKFGTKQIAVIRIKLTED